jgi:Tetratricopeptide repeat
MRRDGLTVPHRKFTRGDIWAALQLYREAFEEDTAFALAHAISGNAYIDLTILGLTPQIGFPRAREHVIRSLALDTLLEEGYAALGYLQIWGDRDFEAGARSLRRAMMLHPTLPQARSWYGWYALYVRGWPDVAVASVRKSLEVDPLNTARSRDVEWVLYRSGRYQDVLAQAQITWSLDAEVAASLAGSPLAGSYRELGRYDEAIAEYRALQARRRGVVPAGLATTYARMGRDEDAREILREIVRRVEEAGASPLAVVRVYANLGDFDQAFAWLQRGEELRPDAMLSIVADPALDPLRHDARFADLLGQMGLTH